MNAVQKEERESCLVLQECVELQRRKSQDYQNPRSSVKQAMHYRRGIGTIHDMIEQKVLRARSLIEVAELDPDYVVKNESLEDTYKDIVNYCSFAVAQLRGKLPGQVKGHDMFNRRIQTLEDKALEVLAQNITSGDPLPNIAEHIMNRDQEPLKTDHLVEEGRTDRT